MTSQAATAHRHPSDYFNNSQVIAQGKTQRLLDRSVKKAALGLTAFGGFEDIDQADAAIDFLLSIGVGLNLIASKAEFDGQLSEPDTDPEQVIEVMEQIELNFGATGPQW